MSDRSVEEIGELLQRAAAAYVRALGPKLAARAWRGYLASGRGAIVLPWSAVLALARGVKMPVDIGTYLADLDADLFRECVREYDPEVEVVALFVSDDDLKRIRDGARIMDRCHCYRIGGLDTPPEAYRQGAS